jgi:hypothetical protein
MAAAVATALAAAAAANANNPAMSSAISHRQEAAGQPSVPPDCFRLEELEQFQSFENQTLVEVNYYLWLHSAALAQTSGHQGFLYFLELVFEGGDPLLLSSGEDSAAIRVSSAAALLDTARRLQALHGRAAIQRMRANTSPIWQPLLGKTLSDINLARHESGLYANHALQLDFGDRQIVVQLAEKEGLDIVAH